MLCLSVWALIMEHHRLNGLNKRNLLPTVLEAGKFKIKVQQGLVSGESSLPGLQTALFSLGAHMAFSSVLAHG